MYFRHLLIGIASFAIVVNTSFAALTDVPASNPHRGAIEFLQTKGVAKDGRFYPARVVSLVEFLAMGFRAADVSVPTTTSTRFNDVKADAWFAPVVARADQLGLLADYRGVLNPNRPVTKAEAARLALGIFGIGIPANITDEDVGMRDVPATHAYAPFVYRAMKLGVLDPIGNNRFGVQLRLTRADAAELFYALTKVNDEASATIVIGGASSIPNVNVLETVWDEILKTYVDASKIDQQKMLDGAVKGAVDALGDPYSTYFPPEEGTAFGDSLSGEVEGIGAQLAVDEVTGDLVVIAPIKGSPAEAAGLQPKDVIIAVDGEAVKGLAINDVVKKIKGTAGTNVTIAIRRGTSALTFTITRAKVDVKSVTVEYLNNIALLSVAQFGSTTAKEFATAATDIVAAKPRGIVLDLRNNPGGLLDTAVDMLGYFLPKGSVAAKARFRPDVQATDTIYKTTRDPILRGLPLVVIVNKGSASASEIVAGALQDNKVGTLIGETTFGKGTMQELSYFTNGAALKLTIAHWYSPAEQAIDHHGITPDVTMVNNAQTTSDEQLDAAMSRL